MALDGELSASRNDNFAAVEEASSNLLDRVRAQSTDAIDTRKVSYPIEN